MTWHNLSEIDLFLNFFIKLENIKLIYEYLILYIFL